MDSHFRIRKWGDFSLQFEEEEIHWTTGRAFCGSDFGGFAGDFFTVAFPGDSFKGQNSQNPRLVVEGKFEASSRAFVKSCFCEVHQLPRKGRIC